MRVWLAGNLADLDDRLVVAFAGAGAAEDLIAELDLAAEIDAFTALRADDPAVAASVRMKDRTPAEIFGELRERKNKF